MSRSSQQHTDRDTRQARLRPLLQALCSMATKKSFIGTAWTQEFTGCDKGVLSARGMSVTQHTLQRLTMQTTTDVNRNICKTSSLYRTGKVHPGVLWCQDSTYAWQYHAAATIHFKTCNDHKHPLHIRFTNL